MEMKLHPLAKPIRDRIENVYVAANLSGMEYEKPILVNLAQGDSVVFANGRIIFKPDALQMGIRVPNEFEFKFDVLLGSLVNLVGVDQKRAANSDGLIYFLQIDYNTPNIVDVIAQLAGAAIM